MVYRDEVRRQIGDMLAAGVIQKERTSYISPLVCVKKRDGNIRVCLDARGLNSKIKDLVNPPNPSELMANFKQGQIMSTINLTQAYWQIPVLPDHTKYLGLVFEGETYSFCRFPFGLSTSTASLIRCLNKILEGCNDFAQAYVDDLLIYPENIADHLRHLKTIFQRFSDTGITIKLRQCQFIRENVHFLGHVITSRGIENDEGRFKNISDFPVPRNLRELPGFLGLVNYEHRFCAGYAELTVPLLKLLKKGEKWRCGSDEMESFRVIKSAFLKSMMLVHPDFKRTFYIQCDATAYAVGG
ncbi:unnamed protein product [Acanthoscelides obtectus]|uniref:RNA-directed DNA polymerase n=1 Tax=Acanthoscelides obtectus TaxID=200917 RepID=A0A9P0JU71_ACAOB|nr:unnamed protein product [Acanthoscelides obtectus]CAK1628007.1 Retrovirus-related Pol polyprotein from transposon 17.6 [Acanthoscelides obtectus]